MNILLSNDDGITSNGLISLAKKLSEKNNVLVVAPDGNRSAFSHSLTLSRKLQLNKAEIQNCTAYSLSGTPADCVKFAKLVFKDFNADIVVSGINRGHNLGSDILYSGTVSIACEAAYFGNVSFAFSAFSHGESDFSGYSDYAEKIIDALLPYSDTGDIWNINFPEVDACDVKGIRITKLGKHKYLDKYVKIDKNNYMLVGTPDEEYVNHEDSDIEWIKKNYITVTPILFDRSNHEKIKSLKGLCEKLL